MGRRSRDYSREIDGGEYAGMHLRDSTKDTLASSGNRDDDEIDDGQHAQFLDADTVDSEESIEAEPVEENEEWSDQGSEAEGSDEGGGYAQYIDPDDDIDEDDEEDIEVSGNDEEENSDHEEVRAFVLLNSGYITAWYIHAQWTDAEIESVPYDKLLKARRIMRRQSARSHATEEEDDDEHESIEAKRDIAKKKLREMHLSSHLSSSKPKSPQTSSSSSFLASRERKNAPAVMSSRRPVSRLRQVVKPIQNAKARDPRFDSLSAGPVNLDLHAKSYGFLPDLYQTEIKQLRDQHAKLKRTEIHHAGPRAKSQQAAEIRDQRAHVEQELRRAESRQNERTRRERERSVKADFKKENQRRVDAGLKPFFPKKAQFQEALLRKQFDEMAQGSGTGSGASLRKAMDRKRRKDAHKEKKSLDAALGGGSRTDLRPMRHFSDAPRPHKRGRRG